MKYLIVLLAVACVAYSEDVGAPGTNTAYGYLKGSIALADKRRQMEEKYSSQDQQSRIIGGSAAALGQYRHQAAILIDIIGIETGRGICGASLVSSKRLISAAHCWFDGVHQGWRVEVVLGSVTLFSGGNRQLSSVFINHPNWFPLLVRNDVGVIYLPTPVATTNTIAPIALPSGAELQEDFAGLTAIASGFGLTQAGGDILPNQFLSHVSLRVITNSICRFGIPFFVQNSNICTSGLGTVGACQGDSGGPLIIYRNNNPLLIGVTSFGSGFGCESNLPSVFARTTSFIDFFNQHL